MLRRRIIALLAALFISWTAFAQTSPTSSNGYELYSWKIKGHWHYSLLPRTGRIRTYNEITAPAVVKRDAAGLKSELRKLPKGKEVYWMSDSPAGASKSTAGEILNVKHPSRKRIKGIKAFCDKLGIKLKLS